MFIQKSEYYEIGAMSITEVVGKEKKLQFDAGEIIEITDEQALKIDSRYYIEVDNDNG